MLLQSNNPAEVKYSPPGKKYSTLIAAAKWSPTSFQKVHYLQHNLWVILALIKSLERCSEIPPGHRERQPNLGTKTSPWLLWAPSPALGTSPALCQVVLGPMHSRKLPQHSNNEKRHILRSFSILKRGIPVQTEVQILRRHQKSARERAENKIKPIKGGLKKSLLAQNGFPMEHCIFPSVLFSWSIIT